MWQSVLSPTPLSHITNIDPFATLSRIKCERHIFSKEVSSFVIIVDYVSAYTYSYIMAIQHIYKNGFGINNLQQLICHKNKKKQKNKPIQASIWKKKKIVWIKNIFQPHFSFVFFPIMPRRYSRKRSLCFFICLLLGFFFRFFLILFTHFLCLSHDIVFFCFWFNHRFVFAPYCFKSSHHQKWRHRSLI